jgi:hypothetical protein
LEKTSGMSAWRGNHKAGLPASGYPGRNLHPRPGDGGVVELEPWEDEDDFVYRYLDDKEGEAFLVQGSHGDGRCCCVFV